MANMIDLEPATRQMAKLLDGIADNQLGSPTPCTEYTLGDLVDHVGGLALAFTMAATKQPSPGGASDGFGDASRLPDDWRSQIQQQLTSLAEAWRDPDAWQGMTKAGPVEMPGEIAALVTLNELVTHGWDVAVASNQPFDCAPEVLGAVEEFGAVMFANDEDRGEAFGPAVAVDPQAPQLDRIAGLNGRDPSWSAP